MFGSANFDNRSLELNDELNVAVANCELAARLLADFEQDRNLLAASIPVLAAAADADESP